jgi:hypothetical protein
MSAHPLEQTLYVGKIAQSSATHNTSSGLCSVLESCTATELHGANHTEASWRCLHGISDCQKSMERTNVAHSTCCVLLFSELNCHRMQYSSP